MELVVKRFNELTLSELYDILKLRVDVFVIEQHCAYGEIDGNDPDAIHVFFRDSDGIAAYLRVLNRGVFFPEPAISRVISARRRCGIGSKLLQEGIKTAVEKFGATSIRIEAQTYARPFYEAQGFRKVSDEFLDAGISHIEMLWEKPDSF